MDEISVPIELPLDDEGFIRRECPHCELQFKWFHRQTPGDASRDDEPQEPVEYHCPYCAQSAQADAWWTREQIQHAQETAAAHVLNPLLGQLKSDLERANDPGGMLHVEVHTDRVPEPEPITESDDVLRVDFPCHPDEPLKLDPLWTQDVACLICGKRYPLDQVRS